MTLVRRAFLVGAALLIAVLALRVALVTAFVGSRPELAVEVWQAHPAVQLDTGLRAIGASVAAGRPPAAATTASLRGLIARDPLNPGPLLVEGTNAFAANDLARSERLLLAASKLDPLAPAPRFLLAQLYLRQNRAEEGFAQVGFLFQRLNGDAAPLVPALAQYAAQPGAAPRLKRLLDSQPVVRGQVLALLADEPANLPVITALAPRIAGENDQEWRQRLLAALVMRQDYARAYDLWREWGKVAAPAAAGIFNPRFLAGGPPPPFNWRLASAASGTAEPQSGGGLHLLYFGRDEAVLADQLLLLSPGRYRLDFSARGETTGLLWSLTCLPGTTRQDVPLATSRAVFTVAPTGCAAQRLELRGTMGDYPMTVDTTVTPVTLRKVGQP